MKAIIERLPSRLQGNYAQNTAGLGGNTKEMNEAAMNIVCGLKDMWVDVVRTGLSPHAFDHAPDAWINSYVELQWQLYRVLNEPDGPGTGGTIVGQLAVGELIEDLRRLIERTVKIVMLTDKRATEYEAWEVRWNSVQFV